MTTVKIEAVTTPLEKAIFHIFPAYCKGCGLCKEKCPNAVLKWSDKLGVYGTPTVEPIEEDGCIACKICEAVCPDCAILIERTKKPKA